MAVPKRVRGMAEAFYGRAAVYDAAIDAESDEGLRAALERNLFADKAGSGIDPAAVGSMAGYVLTAGRRLAEIPRDDVMSAALTWPAVPTGPAAVAGDTE